MPEMSTYRCKICGRQRSYAARRPDCHPFCCQRCKMIDLGKWFNGEFVIESDLLPHDLDEASTDPDPPLA